jgi:hypothetical protein
MGQFVDAVGVYMSAAVPQQWSPAAHSMFPADFRQAVRTLLLCAHRQQRGQQRQQQQREQQEEEGGAAGDGSAASLGSLPRDRVLHSLVQCLNNMCYHSFTSVQGAGYTPLVWSEEEAMVTGYGYGDTVWYGTARGGGGRVGAPAAGGGRGLWGR